MYFMVFQELRQGRSKYITDATFRKSENVRIYYRAFQIAHQQAKVVCELGP